MKVVYQGKEIEAVRVEPVRSNELWNEYQLADGKVLKVKLILVDVVKAVTEKSPDGEPLYITRSHNIVKVE